MRILIFTECACIRVTADGARIVHAEVWRDSDTGQWTATESLAPVPDALRWQAEQQYGPTDPDDDEWWLLP